MIDNIDRLLTQLANHDSEADTINDDLANGTVSEHFTNQKTLFDTQTSNNTDQLPEHLQNVMCGKPLNHTDGTITWCTRKPGHDGECRTGWQPTTQPIGYHGNQN